MTRRILSACLLSVLLVPAVVQSLGLGEIRLNSYLNQPLDAEIDLTLSSPDELRSLELRIPDRETFARLGLERPRFLDQVEFEVEGAPGSRARVTVRSRDPVVEPFLTFLVEATWTGGRLLREYTVLLDPPAFMPQAEAPAAAPVQAPAATEEGTLTRPAEVAPPVPEPAPAPAPAAKPTPGFEAAPGTYGPVQRNETLWGIAEGVRPEPAVTMNQMMMALYEANPDAFEGNINRLRAGTILRVPDRAEILRLGEGEATRAVMAQNEAWRGRIERPRLELVPPSEDAGDAPVAGSGAPGEGASAGAEAARLSAELESTRRLLEVRDAEIARLQTRLEELEQLAEQERIAAEGPAIEAPITEVALDEEPLTAAPVTEDLAEIAGVDPETGEPLAETAAETPAAGEEPVVEEPVAEEPAAVQPQAAAPVSAPEPSLASRLGDLLGSLWLWLVLGLALLAGAALWFVKSRRAEDDLASTWASEEEFGSTGDTQTLSPPKRDEPAAIVVEEQQLAAPEMREDDVTPTAAEADDLLFSPEPETAEITGGEGGALGSDADYEYPFEDTIAGDAAVALDQQDPLAEADFHMAYGLYDQAAELVKGAIAREPDRLDLRRKLLDICFVWGNRDEFMAQAMEFKNLVGEASSGEWNKVAIMGRQICPGEAVFEEAEAEMGGAELDIEFGDAGGDSKAGLPDRDVLDFDLGEATGESPAVDELLEEDAEPTSMGLADSGVIDFDVGSTNEYKVPEASVEPTRETPKLEVPDADSDHTAELAIEDLGLDLDLGETGQHALDELAAQEPDFDVGETGTRESPDTSGLAGIFDEADEADELPKPEESAFGDDDDTAIAQAEAMPDTGDEGETQVAEIVGDGDSVMTSTGIFNFDDTSLMNTGEADKTAVFTGTDTATDAVERDEPADDDWAGLDRPEALEDDEDTLHPGEVRALDEDTLHPGEVQGLDEDTVRETTLDPGSPDSAATATVEALGMSGDADADSTGEYESVDDDLNLDDLTAALKADVESTAEYPAAGDDESGGTNLLEDLLGDDQATQIAPGLSGILAGKSVGGDGEETAQVHALEPDPITMSEVGTKLDLARAYIDMGDPDGARSILEEVMDEGSDGQKDEARQLIESLS